MKLNAEYLMGLVLPRVEQLLEDRDRLERDHPIDGAVFLEPAKGGDRALDWMMKELFNRRDRDFQERYVGRIDELQRIQDDDDPSRQVDAIWAFFDNRVDRASLYLHALRPDQFVFYRKMDVEEAIFEGLEILAAGYHELELEFTAVPERGREQYERLNGALQDFAAKIWPSPEDRYLRLMLLLYWVLPELMRPKTELKRYWVGMAKSKENIDEILHLAPGERTVWSATYQVERGDYYLVYCTIPVKGIAAIFQAVGRSWCDPMGGWKGHWVEIEKVADGDISLDVMKADPDLSAWGPVRRQFQGTVLEQVAPKDFNRVRELFIAQGMAPSAVEAAPLPEFYALGEFATEKEFEEQRIEPLLRELGFGESKYQYRVDFWVGCQKHPCRIDYLVRDDKKAAVSLFEDKKTTKGYRRETDAYHQGRSYAAQLGLRSFVVAAPEGIKMYVRHRGTQGFTAPDAPVFEKAWPELESADTRKEFKRLLLRYAPKPE